MRDHAAQIIDDVPAEPLTKLFFCVKTFTDTVEAFGAARGVEGQLAAAQLRFGQRADARAALAAALLDAVQDDFWVLFVEQYPALAPLLEGEDWAACAPRLGPFVARILPAGRAFAARLGLPAPARAPELPLTDRDRELARLVAGRCTNKEIAAALYLSEGTVKQYINQLYAKLDMGGDPRTRRARLAEWYQKNAPRN